MSVVLSCKATTTTIIVGYIPYWRDSIPVSEPRKRESREVLQQIGRELGGKVLSQAIPEVP